jgi:Fur family transcriptional regulator, peroxide stress response regulator
MQDILNTNARAVLEVLQASQGHPTAMEVYETVRRERPRIGLATVYRILRQMTEQGLIKELGYGSGCARYDACTRRHDHAFCTECGALLDIPQDIQLANKALQVAAHSTGFELGSYEVRIYGRCLTCQTRRNE